jgi:prephenate dehydrogenase
MSRLGFVAGKSLEISSPVYRLRIAMIGRILAQDPRLYAEIQIFNPFVKDVLHTLSESSRSLENLVTAKDVDGFIAEFKVAADAFGDFTQWAKEESDRLMSLMSERSSTEVKG